MLPLVTSVAEPQNAACPSLVGTSLYTTMNSLLGGFLDPAVLAKPEAVQQDRGVDSGPGPWHSLRKKN